MSQNSSVRRYRNGNSGWYDLRGGPNSWSRSRYGANVRILTSTDATGYCAIAVAAKGKGSVVGVALGRPSGADAVNRAIEQCLKVGGINPKIRWRFKG
jgi:hypothetical protein